MIRRQFLTGALAALAAPAVIRTPGVLMPVKRVPGVVSVSLSLTEPPDISEIQAALTRAFMAEMPVRYDDAGRERLVAAAMRELDCFTWPMGRPVDITITALGRDTRHSTPPSSLTFS